RVDLGELAQMNGVIEDEILPPGPEPMQGRGPGGKACGGGNRNGDRGSRTGFRGKKAAHGFRQALTRGGCDLKLPSPTPAEPLQLPVCGGQRLRVQISLLTSQFRTRTLEVCQVSSTMTAKNPAPAKVGTVSAEFDGKTIEFP